ncbi:MAG: ATP-grasp domain-containing protein [Ignavibacteriaceae bacterium]
MKKKALKVVVAFNEAHPEFYHTQDEIKGKKLDFVPFFEVEKISPIEEYEILAQKLEKTGIDAYPLNIKDNIHKLLEDIKKNQPDVIFNFIELYNEDARLEMDVVGLLELTGVSYTGAPPMALANCQSKVLAKRLLKSYGIQTPDFIVVKELTKKLKHQLRFPLMVKPAFEDASVGIENSSIVENNARLKERIEYVHKIFCQPALVEEFIDGRELNVAIMGDQNPAALPISEIDFTEMPDHLYNIVSYQAKWDPQDEAYHKTIPICPAKLPRGITTQAKQIAIKAFKIMTCRDYSRIDIRLSKDNELYVLEVNPNPDLTEGAGFMRSAEAAGYSYTTTLKKIIQLAYNRGKRKNGLV